MDSHDNTPGMHRALKLPEILLMITENVVDGHNARRTGTLHSMVLTNRAFRDTALPSLWRYLSGLMPLARLILLDIANREEVEEVDGVLFSKRTFQAFHNHLALVERINGMEDGLSRTESFLLATTLETLVRDNRRSISAPRLRDVQVRSLTGMAFRWLDLLLGGADLTRLSIETHATTVRSYDECVSTILSRIFESLHERASNLITLQILAHSVLRHHPLLKKEIMHAATRLPNLETLSWRFIIDASGLQLIPSRIHHLELALGFDEFPQIAPLTLPGLRELVLIGTSSNIPRVLELLQVPSLLFLELAINLPLPMEAGLIHAVGALIHSVASTSSQLRSIDLRLIFSFNSVDLSNLIPSVSLVPIHSLEDLTICVEHADHFVCRDSDIFWFAQTWPGLRNLRIRHEYDEEDIDREEALPFTTITGLQPLAECCPQLTRLALAVDMRQFDLSIQSQSCTPQTALRYLEFREGTIFESDEAKASSLKSFIATMWPNVRLASLAYSDDRIRVFCDTFNDQ